MNTTDVERISRFRKAVTLGQSTGDTAARNKRRLPEFAGQCPEEEENRSIVRLKSCLTGGFLFNQSLPGENNSQTHIQSRKAVEIGVYSGKENTQWTDTKAVLKFLKNYVQERAEFLHNVSGAKLKPIERIIGDRYLDNQKFVMITTI